MKHALIIFLLLLVHGIQAQQHKAFFQVKPGSAILILDEDTIGTADGAVIRFGFNEHKSLIEHEVRLIADGYDNYTQTLQMDMGKRETFRIEMERSLPKLSNEPDYLIDFDKALSSIEYNTEVGNKAYWLFKYDEELDVGQSYYDIVEAMQKIGLETITDEDGDVKLDETLKPLKSDVLVRAQIQTLQVERNAFNSYLGNTATSSIQWTFIDRYTKDTLHSKAVTNTYDFESSDVSTVLPNVFLESFYVLFADNQPLVDTLSSHSVSAAKEALHLINNPPEPEVDSIIIDTTLSDSLITDSVAGISASSSVVKGVNSAIIGSGMGGKVAFKMKKPRRIRKPKKDLHEGVVSLLDGSGRAGAVVSSDGYILTVVGIEEQGDSVEVLFSNGIKLKAGVLIREQELTMLQVGAKSLKGLQLTRLEVLSPQTRLMTSEAPKEGKNYLEGLDLLMVESGESGFNISSEITIPLGSPVSLSSSEMVGLIIESKGGGTYRAINASEIFNVFKFDYE